MFLPDLLKGKRILITGGGTGLGKSMGKRFVELGAELDKALAHALAEAGTAAGDQDAFAFEQVGEEHGRVLGFNMAIVS